MRTPALLLIPALLLGCGGGGVTAPADAPEGTGQLRLLLSDSPVDSADHVYLSVARVEVRRVTERASEWVDLWRGEREFDLLALQNERTAVLADALLPVGTYDEIRLVLAEGGGSPIGAPGFRSPCAIVIDGESYPIEVSSGEQSGLKLKGEIEIVRDTLTLLLIDFNVRKSVVRRGRNMEFLLKPTLTLSPLQISGSISGAVTDDADGSALGGVTISAQQDGDEVLSTRTRDDGSYRLVPLREGLYDLVATRGGYAPQRIEGVRVIRERDTAGQDFSLEPSESGTISGTAATGDEYLVVLRWEGYFIAQTTADDDGAFALPDVPEGTHSLELTEDGVVVDSITGIEVEADTDSGEHVLAAP
ncbi:MAG: DUF4382 domain-containing protein [Planctomycetota bacterium]|jgi:hypothetical protein